MVPLVKLAQSSSLCRLLFSRDVEFIVIISGENKVTLSQDNDMNKSRSQENGGLK